MASNSLCSESRHRLSKPRTYTSPSISALLESRADLSFPLSSKQSSPGLGSGLDETMTRQQVRQSLRDHLFGDGQALRKDDGSDEEESSGAADSPRDLRRRLSRTGTMISKRASIRLSLNPLSRSSTSITRDSSTEPEDEEEVKAQIKQKARRDKLAALNQPLSMTVEDDGIEETVISPIRRRSLMTPGLATRNPTDILAKPPIPRKPVPESEHDRYYNRNLSESSPLSRIVALDLANGYSDSETRASTPMDIDYGNLGGLGALRVTNGVASPVPSMRSARSAAPSLRKSAVDLRDQTEYFSLSHGRPFEQRPSIPRLQEVRRSGEFGDAYMEYAKRRSGEISQGDSNYRPSSRKSAILRENSTASAPQRAESPVSNDELKMRWASSSPSKMNVNQTSIIAENYRLDLSENPFAAETTTKPSEFDDDLFEDQASRRGVSLYGVENDAFSDSLVEEEMQEKHARKSFEEKATSEIFGSSWQQTEKLELDECARCPSIAKADSGYSSGSSLRSSKRSALQVQEVRETKIASQDTGASTSPRSSDLVVVERTPSAAPSRPQLTNVSTATTKSSIFTWSFQNSSETIPTVISTNTSDSQSSSTSRRLQKRRPKSQPPPADRIFYQSHIDITSAALIPSIPLEVAERNARRLRDLPPLDHTLPSVDHEKLEPEMKHSPPVSAPLRFPTPTLEKASRAEFDEWQKSRRGSKRQSLFRSLKTQTGSDHQDEVISEDLDTIATLGDVAKSLGTGPYDVALLQQPSAIRSANQKAHKSLNQIRASAPPPKSTIGMNDYEAYEVSRLRTMYRASSLDAGALKPQLTSPPTPEKKHFNDRGGVPGKMPRLNVVDKQLPPLPSIPVSVQVQTKEAQLIDNSQDRGRTRRPAQWKAQSMIAPRASNFGHPGQSTVDWTASREAWARHRESAGEALTGSHAEPSQNQLSPKHLEVPPVPPTGASSRRSLPSPERYPFTQPRTRVDVIRSEEQKGVSRRSLPPPSHNSWTASVPETTQSEQHSASTSPRSQTPEIPAGTVARLSGRFNNGFGYSYEHGYGIGGSAGTRNSASSASRKSVEVSKGFGLDLSDIPVFISPSH